MVSTGVVLALGVVLERSMVTLSALHSTTMSGDFSAALCCGVRQMTKSARAWLAPLPVTSISSAICSASKAVLLHEQLKEFLPDAFFGRQWDPRLASGLNISIAPDLDLIRFGVGLWFWSSSWPYGLLLFGAQVPSAAPRRSSCNVRIRQQ